MVQQKDNKKAAPQPPAGQMQSAGNPPQPPAGQMQSAGFPPQPPAGQMPPAGFPPQPPAGQMPPAGFPPQGAYPYGMYPQYPPAGYPPMDMGAYNMPPGGYPPQGGYYPPIGGQTPPQGGGYPPMGGGYPPAGGPMPQGGAYPPAGYPPQAPEDTTPANFQLGTKLPAKLKVKAPKNSLKFDEEYFIRLLAGSISLSKDEKKKIVESIPKLKQSQIDELIRIFEEERQKFAALSKKHVPQLEKLAVQHHSEWMDLENESQLSQKKEEDTSKAEEIRKKLGI